MSSKRKIEDISNSVIGTIGTNRMSGDSNANSNTATRKKKDEVEGFNC